MSPSFTRLSCTIIAALVFSLVVVPAYGNGPDQYGYIAIAIPYSFEDLSGGPSTAILTGSEDDVIEIPIGFPFTIYGVTYTTVWVSSNGLLTFGGGETSGVPLDLTKNSPPQNRKTIAPLWQDWTFAYDDPGVHSNVYYQTAGTPGARRLIVQWNKPQAYYSFPYTDTVTFEAKLFEGLNNVEFHYQDAAIDGSPEYSNGTASTVGIRDINGQTNGRNLQWSFNQAVINNGSAVRYTSPVFRVNSMTKFATSTVLQCTGAPSKPNWVEATTDLKNTAFARLGSSVMADANGNFTFTDPSPGMKKFYRVGFP